MVTERDIGRLTSAYVLIATVQVFTALVVFGLRYGFTPASIALAHFGNGEAPGLSFSTWLESAWPHLLAINTVTFALAHLLTFIDVNSHRHFKLAINLMLSGMIHTLSGGLLLFLGPPFAVIKLLSLVWFQSAFFMTCWRILKSAWASQTKSVTSSANR